MSRGKSGIFEGYICQLSDRRCLKRCTAIGSAFAGAGYHMPGCPVGLEWARQRIAAGTPYPHDLENVARAHDDDDPVCMCEVCRSYAAEDNA
jgi:hypothetical protein